MGKKQDFVDYYQVLRIWPTATADAIKKAYFNMAKLYHPDVVGKGGEGRAGDVPGDVDFKLINEAFAILSDPIKRRKYDESLKQNGSGNQRSTVKEADKRSAQLAFEQARTAMKHNRYDKAVVLLKSAIKYDDSNAAYHSWYGFALGALNTRLHEARDACKKALEMEFYNADYHANLGFVYLQAGLKSTAGESFREALKWDPEHTLALKYLNNNKKPQNGGFMKGLLSRFGLGSTGPAR
ncbi:MAG: DnaJ domain-containing protein [Candidatus Latescibacterota bacterium]|nr:MAG: DnaJ domain-containing protein [Candidatus Latescibacterota bacterium]